MKKLKSLLIITALVTLSILVCRQNVSNIFIRSNKDNDFVKYIEEPKNDFVWVANSDLEGVEDSLLSVSLDSLKKRFNCEDRLHLSRIAQRGEFWVLYNWVKGQHGELQCHEAITVTTHGDYTFLQNLRPLIERWNGPVSVALYAPGFDLLTTLTVIQQARHCIPLVKKWVSFHAFFQQEHLPLEIPNLNYTMETNYTTNCTDFETVELNRSISYIAQRGLEYPVNVARNIARDSALTHLVLAIDIELYPSPGMARAVLQMIARDPPSLRRDKPYVFTLPEFEVNKNKQIPANKSVLLKMLKKYEAIPMHLFVCPPCHKIPHFKEWREQEQTPEMEIMGVGKRSYIYRVWEAIHIGPRDELPPYDERITWEAKGNKMSQVYILCLLDYDFLILNNAFVTHKPGIKLSSLFTNNTEVKQRHDNTTKILRYLARHEYNVLYGYRPGCHI